MSDFWDSPISWDFQDKVLIRQDRLRRVLRLLAIYVLSIPPATIEDELYWSHEDTNKFISELQRAFKKMELTLEYEQDKGLFYDALS